LGAPGVGGCNERLDASVAAFLEAVSAGTPTPGGGSVAALAGALAAALGIMACRIGPPTGPDKPAHTATQLHATEQRLLSLRSKLQALIQSDADAYANVMNAYRMPKDDSSRAAAIVKHLEAATEVPLETATLAAEAATVLRELLPLTKPSVASDLKVGLLMALAAIEGGLENVKTNLKSIKKPDLINKYRAQLAAIEESLVQLRRVC
ncbi:MAG TPA: cyclodeaminase/cyclohydrolase family protein, partial [Nitrospiraceae bacterium]|nr:cyclodeaminase/cyclohydrolase family protein [Nitrospiraceae bacterium]